MYDMRIHGIFDTSYKRRMSQAEVGDFHPTVPFGRDSDTGECRAEDRNQVLKGYVSG